MSHGKAVPNKAVATHTVHTEVLISPKLQTQGNWSHPVPVPVPFQTPVREKEVVREKDCEIVGVCEREYVRDKERKREKEKIQPAGLFFSSLKRGKKSWNRVRRGSRINLSIEGCFGRRGLEMSAGNSVQRYNFTLSSFPAQYTAAISIIDSKSPVMHHFPS